MLHWNCVHIKIRTTILLQDISLKLQRGESLGIIGGNGTGKTVLAKAIAGIFPVFGTNNSEAFQASYVSFQSEIHLKHGAKGYRQQRWNWTDPEFVPTVQEEFNKLEHQSQLQNLIKRFNFEHHLDRYVISLSNGEQRKFELIKALSNEPDVLVIDNAFNGLDTSSRQLLAEMLNQLVESGHSVVLTGLKETDFPKQFQTFVYIDEDKNCRLINRSQIPETNDQTQPDFNLMPPWQNSNYTELIQLKNLNLSIGKKSILNNISWTVKAGECWVLSGGNGSGKTSLLNMIFADNPRAYAANIKLFGQQRGSGESIWDIKNKIGFVSPEMHQYLPGGQSVNDVVSSGFFVSEGLYQKPSSYLRNVAKKWLQVVGLQHLNDQPFGIQAASAQRMILVLRSLVKNPPLLILDEPFQGLDQNNISRMKKLLDLLAKNTNCTMIFVTHFEDEIPDSFQLELKLKNGEIEFCGNRNLTL